MAGMRVYGLAVGAPHAIWTSSEVLSLVSPPVGAEMTCPLDEWVNLCRVRSSNRVTTDQ